MGIGRRVAGLLAVVLLAGCGAAGTAVPGASPSATAGPTGPTGAASSPVASSPPASGAPSGVPTGPVQAGGRTWTHIPTTYGRLLVTTLDGPASGVRLKVWVWLPPQYDDPAFAQRSFPALMLYPGGSGAGYNTWAGPLYGAQKLVATNPATVTPFVFVMPAMQLSERLDTECADLPGLPKVGTFLAVDVRRLVESSFRVLRTRDAWGAAGASSGAYCAMRLVLNHPDAYLAGVSIDGYFAIQTSLAGGRDPAIRAQDPAALAVSAAPDVRLLLWSGGTAGVDLRQAKEFAALVRPPTTARLEVLPGGKHLTSDFARMMPGTFAFLTETLAKPA